MSAPRGSIAVALERQAVVWLSSIRPDGRPHIVPLWFLWDGESIVAFSKPHAQKVRNVRADPRVMVAVGEPGVEFDVELIEAIAELAQVPTRRLLPDAFARKYADLMSHAGITLDRYAAVYSQPIRIRPTRWLSWGGQGWRDVDGGASGPPGDSRQVLNLSLNIAPVAQWIERRPPEPDGLDVALLECDPEQSGPGFTLYVAAS